MRLPYATRDYAIEFSRKITLTIQNFYLFGLISVNPKQFSVTHSPTGKTLTLPTNILIGPILAHKLRSFKSSTRVQAVVLHNFEIEILSPDLDIWIFFLSED